MRRLGLRQWAAALTLVVLLVGFGVPAQGAPAGFTLTSPTSGSIWSPGSAATVTWTGGSPSALVNLSLVDVNAWAVTAAIATAIPNSGSYSWTVPAATPPGTYLVYIEDTLQTTWTYGENFTITDAKPMPDLAIAKKPERPLQAGGAGSYVIMVSNVGTGPAAGPITVTDYLGAGLTFSAASGSGWTCSAAGQTVTCTNPGPLPAGSSLPPLTITVAVAKDAVKVENCASVMMAGALDPNPANDKTCIGTAVTAPTTGSICGIKFDDSNGNGLQDPGEPGLPGWTILLTDAAGNQAASVVTGADGQYCFKGLAMGSYTVSEVNQPGWTQTYPSAGSYPVMLAPQKPNQSGYAFGNHANPKPSVICGIKFHDKNGNGVQDPGEQGLPGWTIQMVDAAGNVMAAVTSGPDGKFCFDGIKPGTYTFQEVMQPNWSQTAPAAPGTYTVTVIPGMNQQPLIFGNTNKQEPCCLTFRFPAGTGDNFATANGLESASPSPTLAASLPATLAAYFDNTQPDHYFAHTFVLPQGNCIRSARLEIRAKPLIAGSTNANDSMGLQFTGVVGAPAWSYHYGPGTWGAGLVALPWQLPNYGAGTLITLDLGSLPGGGNLLPALNAQRFLDFWSQDDTSIDGMRLVVQFCQCGKTAAGTPK